MKPADKTDDIRASRGSPRQLDTCLNSLRAGIGKEKGVERGRHDREQLLHQVQHWLVINDVDLSVDQLADLFLCGGNDARVTMSRIGHADPAGEIQIAFAVVGVYIRAL